MMIKNKIASGFGSVLEWYDFALYGFFAPLIATLYFPSTNNSIALLKTFSVFAVGFIARPFGGLLFGFISDRYGRITTLKLTPILITLPTVCLALLPTYQSIGLLAPLILILCRIAQGICMGGEFTNNIIYLCETARPKARYFLGSIGAATGTLGIFLASSVAAIFTQLFSQDALVAGVWRIPFILSVLIGFIAYRLRKKMIETPTFQNLIETKKVIKNPISNSYQKQRSDYLIAIGLNFLPATAFYYVIIFMPNYLQTIGLNSGDVLTHNAFALFARILVIPLTGFVADKLNGGILIARLGSFLLFSLSLPLLYGVLFNQTLSATFLFIWALLTTLNSAATPGLLIDLLRPETRSTILSFTFNFCFGVFGGIVPVISFFLLEKLGTTAASVYYLMFSALVTLTTTFFLKRTYHAQQQISADSYGKHTEKLS
jgi:MFS transporter, MHS family, proline/betaine transporter